MNGYPVWSAYRWPMTTIAMCRTSPNVRRATAIINVSVVWPRTDQSLIDSWQAAAHPGGLSPLRAASWGSMTPAHIATSGQPRRVAANASKLINLVINLPTSSLLTQCPYLLPALPLRHCGPSPTRDNHPRAAPSEPPCSSTELIISIKSAPADDQSSLL